MYMYIYELKICEILTKSSSHKFLLHVQENGTKLQIIMQVQHYSFKWFSCQYDNNEEQFFNFIVN